MEPWRVHYQPSSSRSIRFYSGSAVLSEIYFDLMAVRKSVPERGNNGSVFGFVAARDFPDGTTTGRSAVFVNPAAPGFKILGATLVGDRLQRSNRDLVLGFHGHAHDPYLVRIRTFPPEFEVTSRSASSPIGHYCMKSGRSSSPLSSGSRPISSRSSSETGSPPPS